MGVTAPLGVFHGEQGDRMDNDELYFARRATDERAAAALATDQRARQAHVELAERYEDLSAAIADSVPDLNPLLSDAA